MEKLYMVRIQRQDDCSVTYTIIYEGNDSDEATSVMLQDVEEFEKQGLHDIYTLPNGGVGAITADGKKTVWRFAATK